MSPVEIAYIAGLFDGEGNIMCKQYMRKKSNNKKAYLIWYIRAEVAMAEEETIKWLHETLGMGWVAPKRYHCKPKWKPQWRWCCGYRDCLKFAKLIIPYARVKRKVLQKVINHYDKLPVRHTNDRDVCVLHVVSRHRDRLLEQEVIEEALWEKLKNWNLGKG